MTTPKSTQRVPRFKDLTGQTFGRLTVVSLAENEEGRKGVYWVCRCECNEVCTVRGDHMVRGRTRSCGCLNREVAARRQLTHGLSKTDEYGIWWKMIRRCQDPRDNAYHHYGGRGITVCDRWRNSFEAFLEDMGPRPSLKHSIERVDNNKGYCPENCEWATQWVQSRNRRTNVLVEYKGQIKPLCDWCELLGLYVGSVRSRFRRGWSIEEAFTTPTENRLELPQVLEILRRCSLGEDKKALATEFGISIYSIYDMVKGRTWGHIGGEYRGN